MSLLQVTDVLATKPANGTDIWRPKGCEAIELQHAFEVTVEYPRHWHDEFYLSATLEGESYLECAGSSFSVREGDLVVIAPGEVHANQKFGCTGRTVFLDFKALGEMVEHLVERSVGRLDFRSEILCDKQAASDFVEMHRCLESPSFELEQESTLAQFLYRLAARHGSARGAAGQRDGNEDFAVKRAKQYLEEHFAEKVRLEDLARLTRISPYHFHRSFCRKVGMPPHAYQLQVRIARARRLLQLGHSVSETACLVGFFDQSHFVHAFRRSERVTPSQYARLSKNLQAGKVQTHYFGAAFS